MNEPVPPVAEPRDAYYARAASWSADRIDAMDRSRRVAWIAAAVVAVIAVAEAIALVAPLKTVVPYTILVDRSTGFVEALEGLQSRPVTADAALTDSLLAQYVIAREGFDLATVKTDYRKVALWSAEGARRDYLTLMPAANPESPFNLYPRGTVVSTRIKSVSNLDDGAALVRFETERLGSGQTGNTIENWVAILRYRYSGAPMAIADRLVNPLGFQVFNYRRNQETPPADPAPANATADAPDDAQSVDGT
jgi:type IV secretion system protein VirB8